MDRQTDRQSTGSNLTCTRLKQRLTMSTITDVTIEQTTILIIHKLRTGLMTDLSLCLCPSSYSCDYNRGANPLYLNSYLDSEWPRWWWFPVSFLLFESFLSSFSLQVAIKHVLKDKVPDWGTVSPFFKTYFSSTFRPPFSPSGYWKENASYFLSLSLSRPLFLFVSVCVCFFFYSFSFFFLHFLSGLGSLFHAGPSKGRRPRQPLRSLTLFFLKGGVKRLRQGGTAKAEICDFAFSPFFFPH